MTRDGDTSWDDPVSSRLDPDLAHHSISVPLDDQDTSRFAESDQLGSGSGGRIVRGLDRRLGRDVALKIGDPRHPETLQRLRREATILAALDHPAIVPIYDVVERPDGGLQLALEMVDGLTLGELMATGADTSTLLTHVQKAI